MMREKLLRGYWEIVQKENLEIDINDRLHQFQNFQVLNLHAFMYTSIYFFSLLTIHWKIPYGEEM